MDWSIKTLRRKEKFDHVSFPGTPHLFNTNPQTRSMCRLQDHASFAVFAHSANLYESG